jgi:putative membrane protein
VTTDPAPPGTNPLLPPPPRPTPDDRALLAEPSRQSPLGLVFIAMRFVRQVGVSGLVAAVVVILNAGAAIVVFTIAVLVAIVVLTLSLASWWRFTFAVEHDELVVTRGIFSVERLSIPLDRVQSVAVDQRLLHRPLGLVRAAVDTAGSSGAELEIDAVDRRVAEALRRVASDARTGLRDDAERGDGRTDAPPPPDRVLVHRSWTDLVVVAITGAPWAGLAVLAPIIAFSDELGQLGGIGAWFGDRYDDVGDATDGSAAAVLVAVVAIIAIITVVGAVLQVVREVLTNWDLTLSRTPSGLRRTAGLLSTTSRSSTIRRVQLLTTSDNPVQRRLGFTQLRLQVHGDNDLVVPGARAAEVGELRRLVLAASEPPRFDRSISRWYVFRAVRNTAAVLVVATVLAFFVVGAWALWLMCLLPLRGVGAHLRWRRYRWWFAEGRIAVSHGLVRRHTSETALVKAQSVVLSRSWFEWRRGLATVQLSFADGSITVPLVELDEALDLRDRVLFVVESQLQPVL